MSLNRSEQTLYDYIKAHPEERQHLQQKVRSISSGPESVERAVARIDAELWRYFEERSGVVPTLRADARAFGTGRISMKNLAEYLVRIWTDPKPKAPAAGAVADGPPGK
jgi:hypothetical protein